MAKWIWNKSEYKDDEYVEFVSTFSCDSKKVTMIIAAETDYMVYLNNKLVGFGQFPFYPEHPIYDEIKMHAKVGLNKLKIIVYHSGGSFSTNYNQQPGLYFVIKDNDKILLESNEDILSRESKLYVGGVNPIITAQLGYAVTIDNSKSNNKLDYEKSVEVNKSYNFRKRDNLKLKLLPRCEVTYLKIEDNHILIDLGKETVGYLDLDFISSRKQTMRICWGEHINDGCVRKEVGGRTFITTFIAKKGRNKFFSTLRRYGLRYLEIFLNKPIDINYIGIVPTIYPFKEKKWNIDDPLRKKIYETSIHTLKCCYHEHYEDCPWREQSFYAMDSRNQMIYQSLVFKNTETIKSALKLMLEENRSDGLLGITFPNRIELTIPSYGLYVPEELMLYYNLSKDKETLELVYPKIKSLTETYLAKFDGDIVYNQSGHPYWNFYEWVEGLDGTPWYQGDSCDALFNMLMIIYLENIAKINKVLGIDGDFKDVIKAIRKGVNKHFYDKEKGVYFFSNEKPMYHKLVNAFAIITGVANKSRADALADRLVNDVTLINSSLAMRGYIYDALLKVNKDKYKDYVLSDIDQTLKYQLDNDATTFWETELGEKDFDNAGSLCHAWSAFPIYYYNKLGVVKK